MPYEQFIYDGPFSLESGSILSGFHLTYTTHGMLNEKKDNVVWVFHALTANSNPAEWWPGLVGSDCFFDPAKYFIVCANMPGSFYGSINPLDIDIETGEPYYRNFPLFTIRDMIRTYKRLRQYLDISRIHIGIGGSMGGQQLLEWAIAEPELFEYIIPIATNAQHSPWGIAFNASQRWCIENDPTWKIKNNDAGIEGLKIARSIALISYRNYNTYKDAQYGIAEHTKNETISRQLFKAETYQHYQGEKLAKRFNAFSYYFLSKSMDSHNVGRNRISVSAALQRISAKALVIGIKTDILFPSIEQQFLAEHIADAEITIIDSYYGHDGFLLEYEQIQQLIGAFLKRKNKAGYILEQVDASLPGHC